MLNGHKKRCSSSSIARGLVGARGFEPRTSCAQGKRATRLRHAPFNAASGNRQRKGREKAASRSPIADFAKLLAPRPESFPPCGWRSTYCRMLAEVHAGWCSPRTSNPVIPSLTGWSVRFRHTSASFSQGPWHGGANRNLYARRLRFAGAHDWRSALRLLQRLTGAAYKNQQNTPSVNSRICSSNRGVGAAETIRSFRSARQSAQRSALRRIPIAIASQVVGREA